MTNKITPAGGAEAYQCRKSGCHANAWTIINGRLECHYCLTIAHFQPITNPEPLTPTGEAK